MIDHWKLNEKYKFQAAVSTLILRVLYFYGYKIMDWNECSRPGPLCCKIITMVTKLTLVVLLQGNNEIMIYRMKDKAKLMHCKIINNKINSVCIKGHHDLCEIKINHLQRG